MSLLRIGCMHCNAPIKDIYWCKNEQKDTVFIRVRCHGAEETMEISSYQLYELRHQEGVAFRPPTPLIQQAPAPPPCGASFWEHQP